MTREWLDNFFTDYKEKLVRDEVKEQLLQFRDLVLEARKNGKKMLFAGNGASTTISSHGALDFTSQLAVRCHSFNDPNFITAFANDFGYEKIFERGVKVYGDEGDIVVLVSSSGRSPNVINAAKIAKEKGLKVVTLSGFDSDNPLHQLGDINLWCDSHSYNVVETIHMIWLIAVVDMIVEDEKDEVGVHGRKIYD